MSSYWTDHLRNDENVKNVSILLFYKIKDNPVIDHCDIVEASTFKINW